MEVEELEDNEAEEEEDKEEEAEEEEEEEEEEEDIDFNPFIRENSPEASSSLSSDNECVHDTPFKPPDETHNCEEEEEIIVQSSVNTDNNVTSPMQVDEEPRTEPNSSVEISKEEVDAISRRTRARHSLANYTLEELETFLQESDDERDLPNVDDQEEYRKFLAAVLIEEGDAEREGKVNENVDEDEDNDADFELELEISTTPTKNLASILTLSKQPQSFISPNTQVSFSTSIRAPSISIGGLKNQRFGCIAAAGSNHLVGSLIQTQGLKFAIVVARFNEVVTSLLLQGALEAFGRYSVKEEDITVVQVPGAFELPVVAQKLGKSGKYHAVICIGAVIRGDTTHYDAVANSAASGVLSAAIGSGVPCIFGVLTCEDMDQALNRAGGKAGNKGAEAAITAIEMASLFEHHLK